MAYEEGFEGEEVSPDSLDFYSWSSDYIEQLRKKGIVEYVTDYQRYREILEKHPVVVAVYTTPTCSACAIYKPIYYMVAEELQDKAKWIEVDAYYAPEAAIEVGVMATPTTMFFVNGEAVDGFVGVMDEDGLKEALEEVLKRHVKKEG